MSKKLSKEKAIEQLWELGELSWKLKGKQKDVYNYLKNDPNDISCVLISRQWGKSFLLLTIAIERCLREPNCIIKYVCPKQKMVERIIKPRVREIIKDCPSHLVPEWKAQEKIWLFPNGSEIQVAGTDNGHYDSIRGGSAHLCIVDEAGFCDELETIVYSVLAPTTDTTNGRILLASTPNDKDPNHDFHEFFVFPLQAEDRLIKYDIYDSPMIDEKKIQRIIDRYPGGSDNIKFRCEYLCEIPRSSELTVVPEFNSEIKKEIIVDETQTPAFYDAYVSMDVGFKDLTVAIFAYYDFHNAKLVILDELIMNGPEMTTDYLAKEILRIEKVRFYDEQFKESKDPFLRIMDNDLKLINDLSRLHDLQFIPTKKDNKEAAINNLRMWVHQGKILIHKRCKHLIYHTENAQWDKSRKKFKHLKDSPSGEVRGGHADALDSLIYLVRNIVESKNPYPDNYGRLAGSGVFDTQRDKFKFGKELKGFVNKIMNIKE